MKKLSKKGYAPAVETVTLNDKNTWYRVTVGQFKTREEAARFARELGEKMKELKGRIPEPDMPPGAPGEEEEEEEQPKGPEPGQEEGETREGKEMPLTPEQAEWLLESFKLDANRRLPMGQEATEPTKPRERLPW